MYEVFTYLLIGFLISWERAQLKIYHLDFWAIVIILIFKPLSVLLLPVMGMTEHPLALPHLAEMTIAFIALVYFVLVPGERSPSEGLMKYTA